MNQQDAVAQFAALLSQTELRPESMFALLSAADAVITDGISGALVVKIPRKGKQVDIQFTTGSASIRLDFGHENGRSRSPA